MNTDFVIQLMLFTLGIFTSCFFLAYLTVTMGVFEPLKNINEVKKRRALLFTIAILFTLSILMLQSICGNGNPATWVQTIFIVFLIHSFAYAIIGVQNKHYSS